MQTSWLLRFGAVSGALLGLSIAIPGAIEAFTGENAATSFVLGIGTAFIPATATGLYLRQARAAGRFGAVAYAVQVLGLALFGGVAYALNLVVFHLGDDPQLAGPTRVALLISLVVFVAGTALFAASMVRARVFPRLPAIGYGVLLPLLALLAPLPDNPVTSGIHVLAGASLCWLAAVLWRPVTASPAPVPAPGYAPAAARG